MPKVWVKVSRCRRKLRLAGFTVCRSLNDQYAILGIYYQNDVSLFYMRECATRLSDSIQLIFFPANCTGVIQSVDQGVTRS